MPLKISGNAKTIPALERNILRHTGVCVIFRLDPLAEVFVKVEQMMRATMSTEQTVAQWRKEFIAILSRGGMGYRGKSNAFVIKASHIVFVKSDGTLAHGRTKISDIVRQQRLI